MDPTRSRRFVVPAGVVKRSLDGELVMLNLDTSKCFGLDDVGSRMYELLVSSESSGQVFETLAAEYDVEPERLRRELDELISSLLDRGLLEEVDG